MALLQLASHRVTGPGSKCVPASLSTGPARSCSRADFLQGHSILWASTCSSVGSSLSWRWISAPPGTSLGCLTMGCRGIPVPGASPACPSSLPSVTAELLPSYIVTPLCDCCYAAFPPFLKYITPEVPPPFLRISTSPASIACMRQGWSFSSFS